jgi:glycosyltransferase involved in cell wall biosynthesis
LTKFGKKDAFYYLLLWCEKFSFKTADVVISTNESYKKIAISRGNKNKEEVFVVRNGPRLDKIRPKSLKQGLKIKGDFEYLVAYIGMISSQERIDILLDAVEYIVFKKNLKNIKFVVIGPGPDLQRIVNQSKKKNLEKFVTFTGFVPFPDFFDILFISDIGVNPEFINEYTDKSTMIKIMDYMVVGKPIVQFKTTEGKFTAGEASLYVKENNVTSFADAIIELLNNTEKREKMGKIGRKRIEEKLNWDIQKIELKKAYDYLERQSK